MCEVRFKVVAGVSEWRAPEQHEASHLIEILHAMEKEAPHHKDSNNDGEETTHELHKSQSRTVNETILGKFSFFSFSLYFSSYSSQTHKTPTIRISIRSTRQDFLAFHIVYERDNHRL